MLEDRPAAARALLGCALLAVLAASVRGQVGGADGVRYSRQMRLAIDQYRRGDDLGAMDRFMEVLVKGDPTERSMANDYLNRITQRMAGAGKIEPPAPRSPTEFEPAPPPRGEREREEGVSSRAPVETYEPPAPVRAEPPDSAPEPAPSDREREQAPSRSQGSGSDDRRVMKEEIDGKLKNRTREVLGSLRKWEEVQVRMANSRLPRAVGFRSSFLFDEGTRFKKDAAKVLEALTDLVFSLGATQVVILPEGALLSDSKIMDMRRTMALSSALMKAGVAPARLRVNLLSSQVDVPKDLNDWRGILILFVYNQPLNLASENELEAEAGPPVSLGVSPSSLDPREGEGSIVEFSVTEPPVGLMSWRFQLLAPGDKPEADMQVLQEVKGAAPVFHQIYWNARKRYFGDPLPPGRYECVLTATDMRNRTSRARQWVEVKGAPPPAAAPPGKTPPAALTGGDQGAFDEEEEESLEPAPKQKGKGRKGKAGLSAKKGKGAKAAPAPKSRKGKPARVKRRPSSVSAASVPKADEPPVDTSAPALAPDGTAPSKPSSVELKGPAKAPDDASSRAMAVNYQVLFQKGTTNITKEGESILARVADTMHYYPLDNINLVGYAYSGEPEAAKLAGKRAEYVSKLLVDRHAMKSERIRTDTKVTEEEAFKVEIYIVEGQ
ncbi:hypothetical protein EPO15_08325 [bacterium]|nr:MAG: hypothetical protein EPO15_08325 [bacterium]